jgi:YfiH family protein
LTAIIRRVILIAAMLQAPNLAALDGLRHGFFTRQGGVSGGLYASLNCGLGSRDNAADVKENRARVAEALGTASDRLLTLFQSHSAKAAIAKTPWDVERAPEADAVVTATPGLAIGVLTADCAPVLFCDRQARIIGAAHAGWRGALSGILDATIEAMEQLGAKRERIVAAIGPAISQKAYEVGADYRDRFLAEEPNSAVFFADDESSGEPHFDLPGYVAERLARTGVGTITDLGFCTYCDETRLFSYRRSQHHGEPDYGRQISAILLT